MNHKTGGHIEKVRKSTHRKYAISQLISALPSHISPTMRRAISNACGVDYSTVRNWLRISQDSPKSIPSDSLFIIHDILREHLPDLELQDLYTRHPNANK